MKVNCWYEDRAVAEAFPGFKAPDRPDMPTSSTWEVRIGGNDCDGIVAISLGRDGNDDPALFLTMGTDDARKLAEALIVRAHAEDAKDDDDDDDDED